MDYKPSIGDAGTFYPMGYALADPQTTERGKIAYVWGPTMVSLELEDGSIPTSVLVWEPGRPGQLDPSGYYFVPDALAPAPASPVGDSTVIKIEEFSGKLPDQSPAEQDRATTMDFGGAIRALKDGKRVARQGWNGKGMWLSLSCPRSQRVPYQSFWSQNNAEFAHAQGGYATVLPSITMKTATGEILMGWLASQTDMLAEDWVVV